MKKYCKLVNNKYNFYKVGWSDGYTGNKSKHKSIIYELYDEVNEIDLIDFVEEYLKGFDKGRHEFNDFGYELEVISQSEIAEDLVKSFKRG